MDEVKMDAEQKVAHYKTWWLSTMMWWAIAIKFNNHTLS